MKKHIHRMIACVLTMTGLMHLGIPGCMAGDIEDMSKVWAQQDLLPRPWKINFSGGSFQITDTTQIIYSHIKNETDENIRFVVDRFLHLLKDHADYSFRLKENQIPDEYSIYLVNGDGISEDVRKTSELKKKLGDQGYLLVIKEDGIQVSGNSYRGLLWGMMTLYQVMTGTGVENNAVPCLSIQDRPHYIWRGFQLDAARATFSMGLIKRMIRICSVFKLNQLYFREGDDELNSVKYNHLPIGHKNPGALTISQIEELIDYADKYGMDLIPEIESLGHASAKAYHYPELLEGGFQEEYWEGFSHTRKAHFKIDKPESYQLLESIYDEWFAILKTPMVHLGLDEVRLPMEKQADHLHKLLPLADKVGKKYGQEFTFLMWSDAPQVPEAYQDRVIRCLWEYGGGDSISLENKNLKKQGIVEYSKKGCKQTVIMAGGSGSKHEPYIFTGQKSAYQNMALWALLGKDKPNFKGLYAVQWHGNSVDLWVPNYLMAADLGWHPPVKLPDIDTELERIKMHRNTIRDATNPNPDEVDPPVWDGILLDGKKWGRDIMTGEKAVDPDIRLKRIIREHVRPYPRMVQFSGDYFKFSKNTRIIYHNSRDVQSIVEKFLDLIGEKGNSKKFQLKSLDTIEPLSVYLVNEARIGKKLQQSGRSVLTPGENAYYLHIGETGIKVCANSNETLLNGMIVLHKILTSPAKRYGVVPGMRIESDEMPEE